MKAKQKRGNGRSTSQLSLNFSTATPASTMQTARAALETRASAEVVGLAHYRSAKIRDVLIADLYNSRVPK